MQLFHFRASGEQEEWAAEEDPEQEGKKKP